MKKTRQHDIEGAILDIPLRYDEQTGLEFEEYPDFLEHRYTPRPESG